MVNEEMDEDENCDNQATGGQYQNGGVSNSAHQYEPSHNDVYSEDMNVTAEQAFEYNRCNTDEQGDTKTLRIQLPDDHRQQTMNQPNPPMDAPPFEPANVQRCIRQNVRIQNQEQLQEVLIVTSLSSSVDSLLSADQNNATNNNNTFDGEEVDSLSESDFSDFSSESSSSEEDENDEMDEDEDKDIKEKELIEKIGGQDQNGGSNSAHQYAPSPNDVYSEDMNITAEQALEYNRCSTNEQGVSKTGAGEEASEECKDDDMDEDEHSVEEEELIEEEAGDANNPSCTSPSAGMSNNQRLRLKAYWLRRDPIRENHHGVFTSYIYYAKVLVQADIGWTETGEVVAIKAVSWRCIRACRNRLSEDFVKEVAALKHVADWHNTEMPGRPIMDSIMESHVLSADTVMSNETHLYIVMPYCDGGDLCERVAESVQMKFSEEEARYWFKHILKGLESLQLMRICHRDLSPENMIILNNKSLVIDFGMCLRIPYSEAGRHLITAQIPCGKLPHMSPALFLRQPFDGHAVDIWAAGTILLFMLTGKRMKNPPLIDRAFDHVDLGISHEAADLLRRMFRKNPEDRLSLEEIRNHPFVQYYQR